MDVIVVTIPATPAAIQVEVPGITGATGAYITNAELDVDNHLILTLSDTTEIDAGVMPPGPQGVSITGATVDGSYHLILSRSAGADIDAGYVRGPAGTNGTNGVSIVGATVDGSYHLILDLSSGPDIDAGYVRGPAGLDGTDGTNGTNGTDGVSITGAAVDGSYHLILTLSNSSTIDAGYVRGPAGSGDMTGPAGATAGNYPVLDATGNILSDSGTKPSDFATAAQGAKADTAVQPGDVHAATSKTTPDDADEIGLFDSAASWVLKKLTWANLKATIETYFDTLYQPTSAQLTLLATTLSRGDGNFIVGDGTNWTVESGSTARSSLGLGTVATLNTGVGSGNIPVLDGSGKLNTSVIAGLTTSMFAANVVDTDPTLAANSSSRIPAQSAVKAYIDGNIEAANALQFKGVLDCSTNPNYPAANAGHLYIVSVAGKIGGASGVTVEANNAIICKTDSTASGTEAAVGAQWSQLQFNLVGALTSANIGSTVQAYDADLNAIAGQTYVAGDMFYWTASGAIAKIAGTTSTGRSLLSIADAAAGRTILGLGTMATQNTGSYVPASGGTFTGSVTFSNSTTVFAAASNTALEIGRTDGVASSAHIDFHSGATATDYDSRILATGGTGVDGAATLNFVSGALQWNGNQIVDTATGQTIGGNKTFSNSITNTVSAAATAGWYYQARHTDYSAGKPQIGFYKPGTTTDEWQIALWDTATNNGTIDMVCSSFTWNNSKVMTVGGADTITGYKSFTGGLQISTAVPEISFVDTDVATVGRNWWIQLNGDNFWVLRDSDNTGGYDTYPLRLDGANAIGYIFGSQLATGDNSLTFVNKIYQGATFTNGYTEETYAANSGTALTIDLANGSVQVITLTGNVTFTFPAAATGKGFTLFIMQDGTGGRTITWPSSAKFPGGVAPTITATASKMDKISFQCPDGTNWIGVVNGQNYL